MFIWLAAVSMAKRADLECGSSPTGRVGPGETTALAAQRIPRRGELSQASAACDVDIKRNQRSVG